ncbi:MAG TPA: metal ABC transporter permease [Candidatus Eisenbacteria bacterium]|nr:metal ABC transporter permease [Candidatus Eisenbacteria bacterium]
MEAFSLLVWPLLACISIAGIHAYLGFHVVERGVIFVDLAMAQVAALGATVGFLVGHDLHSPAATYFSVGSVVVGAAVLALLKAEKRRIPQEAFIGIVYAVAAAAAILIVDRTPEGAEHIKFMLVGNLLAATPEEVLHSTVLYLVVGVLHFVWRRPFFAISQGRTGAMSARAVKWWDFLFYATFGLVVTQSVAIAGVLLVFSYLIVPSVIAMILADGAGIRLALGWAAGILVSVLGMLASYELDLPTGATVVTTFGLALAAALAAHWLLGSRGSSAKPGRG